MAVFPNLEGKGLGRWGTVLMSLVVALVVGGLSVWGSCYVAKEGYRAARYETEFSHKQSAYADFMTGVHQIYTTALERRTLPNNNTVASDSSQNILGMIYEWTRHFYRLVPFVNDRETRDLIRSDMSEYGGWVLKVTDIEQKPDNEEVQREYIEYEVYFREELLEVLFPETEE